MLDNIQQLLNGIKSHAPQSNREMHLREPQQEQTTYRDVDKNYPDIQKHQGLPKHVHLKAPQAAMARVHQHWLTNASYYTATRSRQVDKNYKKISAGDESSSSSEDD